MNKGCQRTRAGLTGNVRSIQPPYGERMCHAQQPATNYSYGEPVCTLLPPSSRLLIKHTSSALCRLNYFGERTAACTSGIESCYGPTTVISAVDGTPAL